MEKTFDVIVAGGGASGLAAAVEASRGGASVLVLEKNHVPGRKILSTGAGKCNFSNAKVTPAAYHPPSAAFLKKTFAALPPADVPEFFSGLGLLTAEGEGGRLFPRSLKAQDVVSALDNELGARGVQVRTLTEVTALRRDGANFLLEARESRPKWQKAAPKGETISLGAARVILACGGPCYPQIGGTSGGYALLRGLGHSVSPLAPAIVPLKTRETFVKDLDGVRVQAALRLTGGGRTLAETQGEILFTAYGVSGPGPLDLSRAAAVALRKGPAHLAADLFPEYRPAEFMSLLEARAKTFAARPFTHFTCGLANEKVCRAAARLAGINEAMSAGIVPAPALRAFAEVLKGLRLEITGTLGFEDAMVTAGGCSLEEIDPVTFASKKVPGLYVTGELLDLDGDSGGYNLHLAWTSGILAGRAAAKN
jgi:predicted Rossmann fold flavoprotein